MSIANGLITTTGIDVITVPVSQVWVVISVMACNYGGSQATLDMYVVPSGGSVGNQTKIIHQRVLESGDSLFLSKEKLLLDAGDKVHFVASIDTSVSVTASYARVS